jgi:outer membrane cobalamin receptor
LAVRKRLDAARARNNVFDKNYELAADYSTGGATVFAGVRWQP